MALTAQINVVDVDPDEDDEVRAGRATERDETQVMIDGLTKELADAWRATGADDANRTSLATLRTKAGFKKAAKKSITVAADDRSEAKRYIRRAAVLHKVTPVYANDKTNEDGTVRIKWTVGPYTPRVRKSTTTNAAPDTSAGTPAPTGDADAHGDAENPTENPATGDGETPTPNAEPAETGRAWGRGSRR